MKQICKVEECQRYCVGRGLCSVHYQRLIRHGTTELLESHDGLRTKYPDEYRSWYAMVRRCTKPNQSSYSKYGANGIKLCERWRGAHGFRNFLDDMGEKPKHGDTDGGLPIYTIDRKDSAIGYEPSNCVWANWREQASHRSNTSSHPGVYRHPNGLWCAHWMERRKQRVKYFKTFDEAFEARKKWEKENPLS